MSVVIGYYEKMILTSMIVEEIKAHFPDYLDKRSKGFMELNISTFETAEGFDIYVPHKYGEENIKECINIALEKWLQQMQLNGEVNEQ